MPDEGVKAEMKIYPFLNLACIGIVDVGKEENTTPKPSLKQREADVSCRCLPADAPSTFRSYHKLLRRLVGCNRRRCCLVLLRLAPKLPLVTLSVQMSRHPPSTPHMAASPTAYARSWATGAGCLMWSAATVSP